MTMSFSYVVYLIKDNGYILGPECEDLLNTHNAPDFQLFLNEHGKRGCRMIHKDSTHIIFESLNPITVQQVIEEQPTFAKRRWIGEQPEDQHEA